MSDVENTLRQASAEIRELRRRNEILSAKVEVMELFALVLNTKPAYPSVGTTEDVAWRCDKLAQELERDTSALRCGSKP